MRRIDTPNSVPDLNGPGKTGFRDSNKAAGINATELAARLFNSWQEELAGIVEYTGVELDPEDNTQILTALLGIIGENIAPDASETVKGLVELATAAEVLAGTDTGRVPSVASLVAGLLGAGGTGASDYVTFPYKDKTTGARRNIIVQWGVVASGSGSANAQAVTFPIAFPNACFFVQPSVIHPLPTSAGLDVAFLEDPPSTTGFSFSRRSQAASSTVGNTYATRWLAIGY